MILKLRNIKLITFIFILSIEIVIVILLIFNLRNIEKSSIISINPIPKDVVLFPQNDEFKHYYEPVPNSTINLDSALITDLGYPKGTFIRYKINADGLNQLVNYTPEKPKNTYRIVILGDSFTYGLHVNTEDNYPSQLNNLLNENPICKNINSFQVLNLGMEGYDIGYSVERYKLIGQKYNPDLVLWFIIDADLYRINELQIPKTVYYDAQLKKSGKEVVLEKQGIFNTGWHMAINDIFKELGGESKIFDLQKKYFSNFSRYYKGSLLIFDFKPSSDSIAKELAYFKNSRKNTLLYADLPSIYNDTKNYLKDGHPSPSGDAIIAKNLYNYLIKNNVIPCQKP